MGVQLVHLLNQASPIVIPSGLVPKGAYNAGTDYAVGDSVDYNGSSYVMHTDAAAGTVPTNTTYWQVLANKGDTGATGADSTVPGPAGADGLTVSVNSVTQVAGDISLTQDNIPDGTTNKAYTATEQTKLAAITGTNTGDQPLGSRTITGTANQITVTNGDGVSGNPTLSLPQDIHTGASPTFAGATLNGAETIYRNTADATTALQINQNHATSTGLIFDAQFNGSSLVTIGTSVSEGGKGYLNVINPTTNAYGSGLKFTNGSPANSTGLFQMDYDGNLIFRNRNNASQSIYFDFNTSAIFRSGAWSTPRVIINSAALYPTDDSVTTLGTSSLYWSNTYSDAFTLNSTAYLDTSGAGVIDARASFVNVWGKINGKINGAAASYGDLTNSTVYFDLNGRGSVGLNATSGNVTLQGGAGKGLAFAVNNATFGSGVVATISSSGHYLPATDSTYDMGGASNYFANTYTDRLYLNSTAYLDGSTAGVISTTARIDLIASSVPSSNSAAIFTAYPGSTGTTYGQRLKVVGSTASGTYLGTNGETYFSGTGTLSLSVGVSGVTTFQGTSTGVITTAVGTRGSVGNSSTAGTITNAYSLYSLSNSNTGGGSITNNYGLYIENQTAGATLNYALYTNAGLVHFGDTVDLASGKNLTLLAGNITTDTTTGTKIGTATTQKLGFFNATPVVQPASTPANATDLSTAITLVNDLKSKLVTLGLIA